MTDTPKKRGRPPKNGVAMTAAERQAARQKRLRERGYSKELELYRAAIREIDALVGGGPDAVFRLDLHPESQGNYLTSFIARIIRHLDAHLLEIGNQRPETTTPNYSAKIYDHETDALQGSYPRHNPLIYKKK